MHARYKESVPAIVVDCPVSSTGSKPASRNRIGNKPWMLSSTSSNPSHDPGKEIGQSIVGSSEIGHVQFASGPKDPKDFLQCPPFVFRIQMMEYQTGQHTVEGISGIRQSVACPLMPSDVYARLRGFLSGYFQHLGIHIQPDDLRLGMPLLDQDRERSRAAPQVQHPMAGLNLRLLDQPALESRFSKEPFQHRVVERCQPLETQGGDIAFLVGRRAFHFTWFSM